MFELRRRSHEIWRKTISELESRKPGMLRSVASDNKKSKKLPLKSRNTRRSKKKSEKLKKKTGNLSLQPLSTSVVKHKKTKIIP